MSGKAKRNSDDEYALEVCRSFMVGYVRRINDATLRVPVKDVRIGTAKYSRLAQINLDTGIITFSRFAVENVPERGRRYLVLHELAHVKQKNHNQQFWGLVGDHEPDYKRIRKELEQAFIANVKAELARSRKKGAQSPLLPLIRTLEDSKPLAEPASLLRIPSKDPGLVYPQDSGIIAGEDDWWDGLQSGVVCGGSDEPGELDEGYLDHFAY